MSPRAWFVWVPVLAALIAGCAGEPAKSPAQPGAGSKAAKEAPKAVAKTNPGAAAKVEPSGEPKADPAAVAAEPPKTEPAGQPAAAPAAEPKAEPKTEPKVEPKVEPAPEPKTPAKVAPKESKSPVVATVNGDKITREDLDGFISRVTRGQPIPPAQKAEADRQLLDMLITQRLLKKFIDGQNVEIEPELLLEAKIGSYFQQLSKKAEADALGLAQSIRKELDGGKDFAELAKKHSICNSKDKGGELPEFKPDQMVAPFTAAVKGLKVNEISDPVKTEYGYHVIQRLALAEGSDKSLLHARHILVKAKDPGDEVQKLLGDLRAKAKIENKLPPAPPAMLAPKGKAPLLPGPLDDE
jgi:hypothetical protein